MRNLQEYPITIREIISALDTAYQRANDDDCIGNLDAYILGKILGLAKNGLFDDVDKDEFF